MKNINMVWIQEKLALWLKAIKWSIRRHNKRSYIIFAITVGYLILCVIFIAGKIHFQHEYEKARSKRIELVELGRMHDLLRDNKSVDLLAYLLSKGYKLDDCKNDITRIANKVPVNIIAMEENFSQEANNESSLRVELQGSIHHILNFYDNVEKELPWVRCYFESLYVKEKKIFAKLGLCLSK